MDPAQALRPIPFVVRAGRVWLFLIVAAAPFARALADGAEDSPERRYRACMAKARAAPQAAFDDALAWTGLGGGQAARHCLAAALIGLGQHAEGARRLEALAQETRDPAMRAELLAQAAQGWLLAGDAVRADDVLTAAIRIAPADAELLIDRAGARAQLGRYGEAAEDLTAALARTPRRADALALRAGARRFIEDAEGALADAEAALALDPALPEALLERGILRRLKGDEAGARADWLKILVVAPAGLAADAARKNLELMDVKPR
ncbi:MAG: tetratricopeptide repeat protein [Rhodospirillales bacterium]|nr:tetratricopeptide repeat protein [Rhodospirillales bacterium]